MLIRFILPFGRQRPSAGTSLLPREPSEDVYRFRPSSFGASLLTHGLLLSLLWNLPAVSSLVDTPQPVVYLAERPKPDREIWFLPERLPEIAPPNTPPTEVSRGAEASDQQSLIANPPDSVPARQLIWRKTPEPRLPEDVPAPNMVAMSSRETAEAAPPAPIPVIAPPPPPEPVREPLRPFVASVPEQAPAPAETLSAPVPGFEIQAATGSSGFAVLVPGSPLAPPPPRKQFVPSEQLAGSAPSGPAAGTVIGEAPPEIGLEGKTGQGLSAAIVGLAPSAGIDGPPPPGVRPGQFSRGQAVGEPGSPRSGAALPGPPGLQIGPAPGPAVNPSAGSGAWEKYDERFARMARMTVSVPLRPASRTIPPTLERHFGQRLVYTLVVPMEGFADYSGDWIIWFAETVAADTVQTVRMNAPVPSRRRTRVDAALERADSRRQEARIQLAAVIDREGTISGIRVFRSAGPEADQSAAEDLGQWEFHAAMRNGKPVDVDIVVEIPFRAFLGGRAAVP